MKKKLLENPVVGALVVPVAVVLVGAAIVAGVAQMLNAKHSYRDLVREMQSSTFGNRWIAALELSKVISGGGIPPEKIPRLIEDLQGLYLESEDPRTRNFIIIAAGALEDRRTLPLIYEGLKDGHPGIQFRSITALADMPKEGGIDHTQVIGFLRSSDILLQQAAVLALATHRIPQAEGEIARLLEADDKNLRYSAALGLINYKNYGAVPVLKEIFFPPTNSSSPEQRALKLNILTALATNNWKEVSSLVQEVEKRETDLQVISKAREVLKKFSSVE